MLSNVEGKFGVLLTADLSIKGTWHPLFLSQVMFTLLMIGIKVIKNNKNERYSGKSKK